MALWKPARRGQWEGWFWSTDGHILVATKTPWPPETDLDQKLNAGAIISRILRLGPGSAGDLKRMRGIAGSSGCEQCHGKKTTCWRCGGSGRASRTCDYCDESHECFCDHCDEGVVECGHCWSTRLVPCFGVFYVDWRRLREALDEWEGEDIRAALEIQDGAKMLVLFGQDRIAAIMEIREVGSGWDKTEPLLEPGQ
jgi:hypothetical protein